MSFDEKYKLGPLVHRGRAMVFEAREAASGRNVYVHMAAPGQAGPDPLREVREFLLGRVGRGSEIIDVGEHSGSTFVVTPATPELKDLDRWIETEQGKGAPSAGGGPGEFTQMFRAGSEGASSPSESPAAIPLSESPTKADTSATRGWAAQPTPPASGPTYPVESAAARPPETKPIPAAPAAETKAGPGEFTKFFHESSSSGSGADRPDAPAADQGFERVSGFHRPASSGIFGAEPASPPAAAPQGRPPEEPSDIFDADTMAVPQGSEQASPQQPPPRQPPPQPPPSAPQKSTRGEFTQMFSDVSGAPPDLAGPVPAPRGELQGSDPFPHGMGDESQTKMTRFRKVGGGGPAAPSGAPVGGAPGEQTAFPAVRPAGEQAKDRGEFTKLFGTPKAAPRPSDDDVFAETPPLPGDDQPKEKGGEFTEMFRSPGPERQRGAEPSHSEPKRRLDHDPFHSGSDALDLPHVELTEEQKAGQFTELFGKRGGASENWGSGPEQAQGEARGYQGPTHSSHASGGSTDIFQQRRAPAPPSGQPPVSSGPSDYTQILKGRPPGGPSAQAAMPPAPPVEAPAPPPPVPQAAPERSTSASTDNSKLYLILALAFCVLLVIALGIALFFASGESQSPATAGGAQVPQPSVTAPSLSGSGVYPGSVTAPSVSGSGVYPGSVTAPSVSGSGVYPGSVTAPSVSGSSVYPGSVTAPSVSGTSVYPGSVTAPSVSGTSVYPGSVTAPSVSGSSVYPGSVTAPSVSGSSVYPGSVTAPSVSGTSVTAQAPEAGAASDGGGMPYLAIIVALSVLLIASVAVAVYFGLKKA